MITNSIKRFKEILSVTNTNLRVYLCSVLVISQAISEIMFILSGSILGASLFNNDAYSNAYNYFLKYTNFNLESNHFFALLFVGLLSSTLLKILCIYLLNKQIFLTAAHINSVFFKIYLQKNARTMLLSNENILMASLTTKSTLLLQNLVNPLFQLVINSMILITIISVIAAFNFVALITFSLFIILIYTLIYKVISQKISNNSVIIADGLVNIQALIQKYQKNITIVKALSAEGVGQKDFLSKENLLKLALMKNQTLSVLPKHVLEFAALVGIFIVVNLALVENVVTFDIIVLVLGLQKSLPYAQLIFFNRNALLAGEKTIHELHTLAVSEKEPNNLRSVKLSATKMVLVPQAFNLPNGSNIRVPRIEITSGSIIRVSGASGNGKTTFLQNLIGLGGTPLQLEFDKKITHKNCTCGFSIYTTSEDKIFEGTVANNIALFQSEDQVYHKSIQSITKDLGLSEIFGKLANEKQILDNGANLSLGQKQRLLLARVLYLKPKIVVIDELLSGLDITTFNSIISLLKKRLNNSFIFVIAHNDRASLNIERELIIEGDCVREAF